MEESTDREEEEKKKPVMVVAVDSSEHSNYAVEWTLSHFFNSPDPRFRLVLVHARRSATSVAGLGGPGGIDVLPVVESNLRKSAEKVIEMVTALCSSKQVSDVVFELLEGDPRNVLCETVEKYQADLLVVGSHGYGALKRAVLGSVSDYCAHHAHCSVMIVKKPKTKN